VEAIMPEEQTNEPPKNFDELKEKIDKKKHTDVQDIIKQIATRDKLERDYEEDILQVTFNSSPETKRTIKAKRPTQKEMITIMRLSAEAAIYEGRMDAESLNKMLGIYERLPELAASLVVDKKLDTKFWTEKVSFSALQNFITELIRETQKGTGIPEEEMKSFR
jgi:hypothetical protein